ncbi:unnamed protein product [Somion occarium]|uniref:Cora-domain-containing protein n=1 Tax=Somion occarium TaxID=3059160 RepID=A0ABP1CXE5_9APHY
MASPQDNSSILFSSPGSTPRPTRVNSEHSHSPVQHHRSSISSDAAELGQRPPRLSPTLMRSYNPNDPDQQERQRAMDADMAMHLSRARSNTIVSSPVSPPRRSSEELPFPPLSFQEQQDIDVAKVGGGVNGELEPSPSFLPGPAPESQLNHLSVGQDPGLLVALEAAEPDDVTLGGLPMYQASEGRPAYDFSKMEEFVREEKAKLGIHSPAAATPGAFDFRNVGRPTSDENGAGPSAGGQMPSPSDFTIPFPRPRVRQRKISQSQPGPRRGKMALFEQTGAPPPSLTFRAPRLAMGEGGTTLSTVPSYDNLPAAIEAGAPSNGMMQGAGGLGMGSGHDRPYRFSFYSNSLSATIHARSLSELPAEGQTFEDLFLGTSTPEASRQSTRTGASKTGAVPVPQRPSGISKMSNAGGGGGGNVNGPGSSNTDSNTWWLDVQSPTEEEMKLFTKVFSIHPLTTEDILMEETREKIELFRTYYFVCFRSFEQDPYSPTYLEPLNMYVVVFRDGILSNVRRRIKQLKDYISVTSDWISYALIDDITDAFGPLIQSIEYEVDSIDELVLILKEAEQSDMLRRIGTCRKKVMGLLRLMGNKADVVKGLAKRCNENWRMAPTSDIGLYLSDIQDHLITMTQNLNHYEKILSRSHSNYLAQISIEMTDANNQINDVLSKLTALGTVLIPMNLVTGLWGMNVHVPGQDIETGYAWFGGIVAVLSAFAVVAGWLTYKLMVAR